jgi:hypothetical protein
MFIIEVQYFVCEAVGLFYQTDRYNALHSYGTRLPINTIGCRRQATVVRNGHRFISLTYSEVL